MSSSIIANIDTFSPCLRLPGSFLLGKTCRTMTGGSWYYHCYILPATRAQQHPNWIHHPDLFKHVRITKANTRYQIPTGEFKEIYIPNSFSICKQWQNDDTFPSLLSSTCLSKHNRIGHDGHGPTLLRHWLKIGRFFIILLGIKGPGPWAVPSARFLSNKKTYNTKKPQVGV